jgi:nicotinate-nucleotide adenylyltransferase
MKIGILGGAFNPPHIGHLVLATQILERVKLDKVFFIPTNISPHKESENVSADDRLKMVQLAVSDNKAFKVLDLEIKRGGVSYTIDTIKELKSKYPGDEFYLIIGSDLANNFSSWKDSKELDRIAKIVVAQRDNYPLKIENDFIVVNITQIDLSSSQIRELIKKEKPIDKLVPAKVLDYIKKHKLYKN